MLTASALKYKKGGCGFIQNHAALIMCKSQDRRKIKAAFICVPLDCHRENALKSINDEENKQTALLIGFVVFVAYINTSPICIKHNNQCFSSTGKMKSFFLKVQTFKLYHVY